MIEAQHSKQKPVLFYHNALELNIPNVTWIQIDNFKLLSNTKKQISFSDYLVHV